MEFVRKAEAQVSIFVCAFGDADTELLGCDFFTEIVSELPGDDGS